MRTVAWQPCAESSSTSLQPSLQHSSAQRLHLWMHKTFQSIFAARLRESSGTPCTTKTSKFCSAFGLPLLDNMHRSNGSNGKLAEVCQDADEA